MFSKLKNIFSRKVIISLIILLSVIGAIQVRAIFEVNPMQVTPPDSFIKAGLVLTLIEEDEKYYLKKEYFSNTGTYESPATEQQISYEDYSLMRNNGSYDILEKRNRHIVNDVYVDEYYKAYSDNEVMAGNYVAEVIDGYFVPIQYSDGHRAQQTGFINDGGIYYKVTKFVDSDNNYTKSATYWLLSQYEYEQEKLNNSYDFEEIVEWDISDDGNTITKTISYYDAEGNYLMRPIVLQLTGFDDLEEYLNPDDIDPTPTPTGTPTPTTTGTPTPTTVVSPTLVIITPSPSVSVVPSTTVAPSVSPTGTTTTPSVGTPTPTEAPWGGTEVQIDDSGILFENIVSTLTNSATDASGDGSLSDSSLQPAIVQGVYDDAGNFIPMDADGNIVPSEAGVFDEDGNFTPNAGSGYYDSEGVWHPTELIPGVFDEEGNFVTEDGTYDENGNFIPDGGNEETPIEGYLDENGNLILPDGTIIDNQGIVHLDGVTSQLIDNNGIEKVNPYGKLTLDFNGNMVIWNKEGYYDENGLFYGTDGSIGYFDSYGRFTRSRINPFSKTSKGFYDVNGDFHSFNTIFKTENDTLQLILMPDLGISVTSTTVTVPDSPYVYTTNGLTTKDGVTGYFNSDGDFLKSDRNAYKGGFFDDKGRWIDDFLIRIDTTKSASLSYGFFDKYGVYTTPNNDRGYFDETGKFIVNRENPYPSGYYDWNGEFTKFGKIYYDVLGNVHKTGSDEMIATDGSVVIAESEKGIIDKKNNWFKLGNVITPEGHIGHYNEFAEYEDGQIPYADGYYDADGNFFRYDGIVILADGTVGYFDENGVFHEGVQNGIMDSNGNYILADGTVITPDGRIGYYDENGVFHEGENPYVDGYYDENGVWHSFGEEGYVDKNGNTVLPNGLVMTPDGAVGYYDENGNFIELDQNELPEGAWVDENGIIHLADGTLIYPDGTKVLPDGTIILPDGTILPPGSTIDADGTIHLPDGTTILPDGTKILPDGTVILPDGTVGYYDENGNFVEGLPDGAWVDENGVIHLADGTLIYPDGTTVLPDGTVILPDGTVTTGYIDENGNLVLADGTVITPDGKVGYYDENGVWHEGENPYEGGYYDENGVWHEDGEGLPEGAWIDENGVIHLADGTLIYPDGTTVLPDGTVILPDGTVTTGYIDENGNLVLADGTVITPDGKVGYYDENGVWHEGENPYANGYYDENGVWHELENETGIPYEGGYYDENGVWHSFSELPEGAYIDANGNLVMPDGTVITPDGKIGYYDENGVWHEGENPYEGGYYDENGVWHATGYYDADGNYIMSDGTIVKPDGTVILPDGTVVSGYVDENGNLVITDNLSGDGYYDVSGKLMSGENPNANGFYDADGNYYLTGDDGYYDENGTYHAADGTVGYYDENGVFHEGLENPYVNGFYDENGVWHGGSEEAEVMGYYDENGVWHEGENPYEGGYYDENGVWHDASELGYVDSNGNTVLPNGVVLNENGVAGYYDENGIWHEGPIPYEGGYYDENGVWHDITTDANGNMILPNGVVVDSDGNVIGTMGTVEYENTEPLVAYYDENGNLQYGTENPYEGGYYDANGNWHSDNGDAWIDANGNAHVQTEGIGYYDADGNFHLYGQDGYYDENGNYHAADGTVGYYDANGVFHEGENNPYPDGYYDADGNWHPYGEAGYFDAQGNWHDDVTNDVIGYYDENGVWHEGRNPYVNGYYDENGVWHGDGEPLKAYYDANGELQYGDSPYTDGWYDANGNFHPYDADGYFDSTGTYHTKDGDVGYFDADGIWHEGTNPNLYGYYDSEGNFHPAGDTGYFDVNGTYHAADGTFGYYDENGVWHEGQENPYPDGYYDANGNFHPFNEEGWYDADGVFHSYTYYVNRYNAFDNSYIYFTGTWRTATENAQFRLAGNTVQFSINKKAFNQVYADTGFYVGLNSLLEYEEAADILHMIAISTNNVFVQDNEACMLVYNGRMITLTRNDRTTVRTLQKMFENTNIDITVRKSRVMRKFALVDAIESERDIKLKFFDKIITPENPLIVLDNEAYVALNDVADFISYDYSIKPAGKERKVTFKLKKKIQNEQLRSYMAENIVFTTNEGTVEYNDKNGKNVTEYYSKVRPTLITLDSGYTTTYIPVKMVPRFTGCNASYETTSGYIDFSYGDGLPLIQKFYDVSEELVGDDGMAKIDVNADGVPMTSGKTGENIQGTVINKVTPTPMADEDYGTLFGSETLGSLKDDDVE